MPDGPDDVEAGLHPRLTIGMLADSLPASGVRVGSLVDAIGKDLIESWRSQLQEGHDSIRRLVAGSMSSAIADMNLGALAAAQGIASGLTGERLKHAVAEATASYLTGFGQDLRESVIQSIRPAALAATSSLMERIQASSEQQRAYDDALWRLGWWMPPSVSMDFFWEVGRLAHEGRRLQVRHEMTAAARSREFGRAVERWMRLPAFRTRRRFILDGLHDHRHGRYRVSVPTLLPQIEGIAIEAFAPGSKKSGPKAIIKAAADAYEAVMGPALVQTVTILWDYQSFAEVPANNRALNRHRILHGRSTGYASEVNSAKVLFALDLLASLVEDAEGHPKRAKPS